MNTKGIALVSIALLVLVGTTISLTPMNLIATTEEVEDKSNAEVEINIGKEMERNDERDDPANTREITIDRPGDREDLELRGESAGESSGATNEIGHSLDLYHTFD